MPLSLACESALSDPDTCSAATTGTLVGFGIAFAVLVCWGAIALMRRTLH